MRPKVRERAAWTERRAVNEQEETSPCIWIFIGLVVGIAVGLALMMVPNGLDIAQKTTFCPGARSS